MGRKPKTTGPRARDPGAFKSVLVRINTEGWRALKVLAAEQETTLNALAVEAFNDLLKKHGKRQSIENPLLDSYQRYRETAFGRSFCLKQEHLAQPCHERRALMRCQLRG
jgi:hypothetical protein